MEPSSLIPVHLLLATKCSPAEAFYYSSQAGTDLFIGYVWIGLKNPASASSVFFFFFFLCMRLWDLRLQFMNSSRKVWLFSYSSWTVAAKFDFSHSFQSINAHSALFTDPQISLFSNFFIKNGFHDTIHTFKNYFATVFFSFQFQFSVVSKQAL